MSKLVDEHQRFDTLAKYGEIEVIVEFRSSAKKGLLVASSATDQTGLDGKFYPKDKVLKGVGFFEPKWSTDDSWIIK